jgi:hypothetical protein
MDYEERLSGENITLQNQLEAYEEVDKNKRYNQILTIMYENKDTPLTAKEIASIMCLRNLIPTSERNFVSPRLTELSKIGKVEPVGKKKCQWTGKNVTAFRIIL